MNDIGQSRQHEVEEAQYHLAGAANHNHDKDKRATQLSP
jgi:hypothetical protein